MELGKTDVRDFRIEITAIQLHCEIIDNVPYMDRNWGVFIVLNPQGHLSIDKLIIKDLFCQGFCCSGVM